MHTDFFNSNFPLLTKNKFPHSFFILIICFVIIPTTGFSLQFASTDSTAPKVRKISATKYQIGSVILESEKREIYLSGKINMQKGMIELLACAPGGKTHESVLVLDVIPHDLQVSLLLLGLEFHGDLEYQGDPRQPKGDSVEIWVKWKNGNKERLVRGEDLVYDLESKNTMKRTLWVFTGSRVVDNVFQADVEKSLITTYHDPFTILDNPLIAGGDDEVYQVNEKLVPPKGTPIEVILKAISKPKSKE